MMLKVKIIFCIALISIAISLSACGGVVKSVGQSVGKSVVRTVSKAPKFVKGEFKGLNAVGNAIDVAEYLSDSNNNSNGKPVQNQTSKPATRAGAVAGGAVVASELLSNEENWIKDLNSGAYIWNPEPQEGESVRWNGDVIRDGNNLYAQGHGVLEWYMDGQPFETNEGNFEYGKQNGRFVHISPDGEKFFSTWDNGEPISVERSAAQGTLNAKDLSLGEFTIDDRAEKVKSQLGEIISTTTDSDGGKRLKFKDAEIVIKQGKISALVSFSPVLKTPRGIHEGSSSQEVLEKYGENCMKTAFGDQTLYEYAITSADGTPCLLRFAVNNSNGKVDYISERINQDTQENKAVDSDGSAKQTFMNYHKAITNKNYRAAYEMLSSTQREYRGDFNSYAEGFANTISSEVTDINLVSHDEDSCTFDYTLTARDRYQGNKVKVLTFKGQVTLIKDDDRWFIQNARSNKINERLE